MSDALGPPLRLLLDEDLSPRVAQRLREELGVDAIGVRDRGKLGLKDEDVFQLAFDEDRVLVTAVVFDFIKLAGGSEVHGGLVLVHNGELRSDEQFRLLKRVVTRLEGEIAKSGVLQNRALHADVDGTLHFEDVPPAT